MARYGGYQVPDDIEPDVAWAWVHEYRELNEDRLGRVFLWEPFVAEKLRVRRIVLDLVRAQATEDRARDDVMRAWKVLDMDFELTLDAYAEAIRATEAAKAAMHKEP